MSVGNEIYEGASEFGRILAKIGVVIGTIVGLGLIIAGSILLFKKTKRSEKMSGTVTAAECKEHVIERDERKNTMYNCHLEVEYANGKTMKDRIDSSEWYSEGDKIDVYVDPDNEENVSLSSDNTKPFGIILLVIGIFVIGFSWLWLWITNKSKFAAASGGVASTIRMFR